jgi:hypothetical protein
MMMMTVDFMGWKERCVFSFVVAKKKNARRPHHSEIELTYRILVHVMEKVVYFKINLQPKNFHEKIDVKCVRNHSTTLYDPFSGYEIGALEGDTMYMHFLHPVAKEEESQHKDTFF